MTHVELRVATHTTDPSILLVQRWNNVCERNDYKGLFQFS